MFNTIIMFMISKASYSTFNTFNLVPIIVATVILERHTAMTWQCHAWNRPCIPEMLAYD